MAVIWENNTWGTVYKVVLCEKEKEKKKKGNLLFVGLEGANLEGRENYSMS